MDCIDKSVAYTVNPEQAQEEYNRALSDYLSPYPWLADRWVVANMGLEVPCHRNGRWQLYVFNFYTAQHGWLDLRTDIVES